MSLQNFLTYCFMWSKYTSKWLRVFDFALLQITCYF